LASPLENLAGPGKPLRAEPVDDREFAGMPRIDDHRRSHGFLLGLGASSTSATACAVWGMQGSLDVDERLFSDLLEATTEPCLPWRAESRAIRSRPWGGVMENRYW